MNINKILLIRSDRFGEFILTLPAIHAIREGLPKAEITLMANPYGAQLVKGSPDIDKIIEYDDSLCSSLASTFKLAAKFRKISFDAVVIFNPKREFNIIAFLAGIPIRVGYDRKWGFLLNRKIQDLKHLGLKHEVEFNLDLVKLLGIESRQVVFPIAIDKTDTDYIGDILAKEGLGNSALVAVHPWTSDSLKQWPIEYFIGLIKKIKKETGVKIILVGGKDEVFRADSFIREAGGGLINLVGKISLRQLAALFKRVSFLISNDSGPVHLAAAVNTRVIAIFRSDIAGKSSRRWGPYGSGHIVLERSRLEDISVDMVFEAAKKLIRGI
jgi:heptosyltransferase-2